MKKVLSMVICAMLLCCAACAASASQFEWNLEGTIFPLEEPVTFEILSSGHRYASLSNLEQNADWKALLEATNVNFEFVFLGDYDSPEARSNLQMRLMSGEYGDAIMSFYVDTLNEVDIQELAAGKMIIPLTQYITDPNVMPNMVKNVTGPGSTLLPNMKSEDGEVYYLAGVSEINAYTAGEALMMVNSAWLQAWQEARGVDYTPKTLAEFEDMLVFFRDSDLNGNGAKDEIPYFIAQNAYIGCATLEHAMGMYGVATKDSTSDMDIMIDDEGNCFYAYTTDMYKEGLKTFSKWYADGLVWEEIFTGNDETITSVLSNAKNNVGLYNACEDIDGFEPILPPAIDGYSARYHMHPSTRVGVRQPYAVVTDACENPEVLMAFLDLMFDFENNLIWRYGSTRLDNGDVVLNEEGKYVYAPADPDAPELTDEQRSISDFLGAVQVDTLEVFKNVDTESYFGDSARVKGYEMYEAAGIWNPTENLWPRCTILSEHVDDYAFLYTDVATTVAEYRARFVTGELDIEENWDAFQKKLQALGVDEMREIIQATYDAYLNK